jgi:hypothetical protein
MSGHYIGRILSLLPCSIADMMNSNLLLELGRERSRDLIDDAARNRRYRGREADLLAPEDVLLAGRPALVIDARVRAQARLRVQSGALDLS